jgi:hypothetical protein
VLDEDELVENWTLVGREALLAHLRRERLEQPAADRIRRIIGSAISQAEKAQTVLISSRVPTDAAARMLALIAHSADPGTEGRDDQDEAALFDATQVTGIDRFAMIREEPGNVSVKTIEREVFKLRALRRVGLPNGLFADVAPKILASWRARAAAEAPSHLRSHPLLRARRERPGRGDHRAGAGGAAVPGRQQAPPADLAERVRVRGFPDAAGEAAVQGDLGGGGRATVRSSSTSTSA